MSGASRQKAEGEPKKRGRRSMFTDEQRTILLKYYNNGMTSTNRHHMDVMEKCANESQITIDRIKRFIGAENYKRKKVENTEPVEETDTKEPDTEQVKEPNTEQVKEPTPPRKRKTASKPTTRQKRGKVRADEDDDDEDED